MVQGRLASRETLVYKQNSIYFRENQKCDLPYADSELAYNRSDSVPEQVRITIG